MPRILVSARSFLTSRTGIVCLTLASVATAGAAALTLADVNQKLTVITAPFNKPGSALKFEFTSLAIDSVRTLDFGFNALASATGSQNELKLEVKNARYVYGDGTKPQADGELQIDFDLVKAFGQPFLNQMADGLDAFVAEIVSDSAKDYGAAATINTRKSNHIVNANGDVESIAIHLDAAVDFAKLSAGTDVSEIELQTMRVDAELTRTMLKLNVSFVINPKYKRFLSSGEGLKEYVERLLRDDKETYEEISTGLKWLSLLAERAVEMKPSAP